MKEINTNKTYKKKINPRNSESINIEIIETYNGNILFGGPDKEYGISLSDPGGKNNGTYWIDSAYEAMISKSADDLDSYSQLDIDYQLDIDELMNQMEKDHQD